jgi:hypothetical protein
MHPGFCYAHPQLLPLNSVTYKAIVRHYASRQSIMAHTLNHFRMATHSGTMPWVIAPKAEGNAHLSPNLTSIALFLKGVSEPENRGDCV